MSDTINIKIRSTLDGNGLAQARKDVESLVKAMQQAGSSKPSSANYTQVAAQARSAATAVAGMSKADAQAAMTAERLATAQSRAGAAAAAKAASEARAEVASLRLAQAQEKAALGAQKGAGYFEQMGDAAKSGILGIVGPAAVATAAISGTIAVAQSFKDAFNFKAELDASTASIKSQLDGFRNVNATYSEALAFGRQYNITQQETNAILSSSTDILRTSTASVSELETALIRLQSRDVSKPISEASRALRELQSGDTTSIKELFNVPAKDANRMKAEILAGGDAVKVLTSYLDTAKVGMDALKQRTEGAAGAINEAAQAQEALAIAQAKFSTSSFVVGSIKAYANEIQVLAGFLDNGIAGAQQAARELAALQAQQQAYSAALKEGKSEADAAAAGQEAYATVMRNGATEATNAAAATEGARISQNQLTGDTNAATTAIGVNGQALADQTDKTLAAQLQSQQLAQFQQDLANLGGAVAGGLMTSANAALALAQQYGIASSEAAKLIGLQAELARRANAKAALADQRAGERSPGSSGAAEAAAAEERRLQAVYRRLADAPVTATKRGGVGRANAAAAAGQKLENIEQKTGDKLADIDRATQQKLVAIDKKAAEDRLAAAKRLNQAMASNAANRRADNEADDLDLISVSDPKEATKLNDRERAQAASRDREKAAAAEAREAMAAGDAETAEKVYAAREEQIQKQQALDEAYYAKQRELAGDPAAQEALKQQYDEATRAINEATQLQIDFAHAAASEKAAAAQEEKNAVIAAAEEQKNEVISKAQASAAGIKNATASAKASAVADLQAIGAAVDAIPSNKTVTVTVSSSGGGGASAGAQGRSDGAYAGGGDFVTNGPTTITVGDNPGGREFVSVVPLSGTGTTRPVAGGYAMAGGGTIDAGDGYTTPVAGAAGNGGGKAKKGAGGSSNAAADIKAKIEEQRNLIQLLSDMLQLRADMAREVESGTPFNVGFARALAKRAAEFAQFVRAALPAATKDEAEGYKRAAENSRDGIAVLSDLIQLRKDMSDYKDVNPFDVAFVERLTAVGKRIVQMVQSQLVPTTQAEVDRMQRWADLNGSVVSLIKDVSSLNAQMFADYVPPSDAQLNAIAKDANRIAQRMVAIARTYDTKGLDAAKQFVDAVGGTFSAFKDGLLFFQALNSGDFVLNPGNLAKFEKSTAQTMAVAVRLGAMARKIPSQDLAALQLTTQALAGQAEALIKLAAVPFADLPAAARALQLQSNTLLGGARGAGGGGSVVFNIYQQPGQDARQLANEALRLFKQDIGKRR